MPERLDTVDEMLRQWQRERPDLDTSGMTVVLRILFLAGLYDERLKSALEPVGLAPWEFDVLSALLRSDAGSGLSPTELCRYAQLTSGAMTNRIDRLAKRGLVRRRPNPEDGRSTLVLLTAKGRRLVDEIIDARMADAKDCVRTLRAGECLELARLLRRLSVDAPLE